MLSIFTFYAIISKEFYCLGNVMDIKSKLLIGIIQEYIKSKEPIGSEFLKSRQNFDISSATIRNYFKILEKEGALFQPHISSGRIPTYDALHAYWNNVLKILIQSNLILELDILQNLSTRYGIYCILVPKSDNLLEEIIYTHNYLILRFSRSEIVIKYSEALYRFVESLLLMDIGDIIKVASEVGAGELKRKLIALNQVDFDENCYRFGSKFLKDIANIDAQYYLDLLQAKVFMLFKNGIYFNKMLPDGYIAIIHNVEYSNPKINVKQEARMMCVGGLLVDYRNFYAELGFNNFA